MSSRFAEVLMISAIMAPVSFAQFEIYRVDGNVERAVPALYQMGSFQPGETGMARFRIRNTSAQPAALSFLKVGGSGFSLSGVPSMPVGLASQQAVEFQVVFQSAAPGSYSAALDSEGISVLLAATVLPSLTYSVDSQVLGPAPVDFGAVELGTSVSKAFRVANQTPTALAVPIISAAGTGFAVAGIPPSGTILQPQQSTAFTVTYSPAAAGASAGTLVIGGRSYALAGTGVAVALPKPALRISLPQISSATQGAVTVVFDTPARTAGVGELTLNFQPQPAGLNDPAIQFAAGGTRVPFTISPGDTQASFPFQTGTTAGTITFTVTLANNSDSKTVTIAPAAIALTQCQGIRASGTVEIRLTGFDNTRSVTRTTYTFFDAAGNAIPPGPLAVDSAADFSRFFQSSDAGGNFLLRAIFPVTGDASKIAAFEAQIANSVGTAQTGHVNF